MTGVLKLTLASCNSAQLDDWVKHCIDEPLQDTLDYILAHDSRKSKDTGSLSDTSCELSSSSPPSTPNSRLSDTSTASSDDSPTPAEEIDLYAHYRNQFDLPSDLLREIDPKRMARLLPPKLSRRGLMMEEDLKDKLEELEARIAFYMNNVR